MRKVLLLAVLTLPLAGCYHATVNTGLAPSGVQVEKKWANGWLYGLVPPGNLDVGDQCPNGVARVETQLSFLNQVASGLTVGIYTPMTIVATCAS